MKKIKSLVLFFTSIIFFVVPTISSAQTSGYQDLSPLDGFTVENADSFGSFLNNLFVFGLGIAGILALIMIVYGGIQYMGSESVFNKDEGKKRITAAIGGLILALLSIVILNTINPNIVDTSGNFKPPVVELTEKEGVDTTDKVAIYDEETGEFLGFDTNNDKKVDQAYIPPRNGRPGGIDADGDGRIRGGEEYTPPNRFDTNFFPPSNTGDPATSFSNNLKNERVRITYEFQQDPDLRRLLFASTYAEVGSQPGAQIAYMESVMNRAAATGRTLRSILTDTGYYPSATKDKLNRTDVPDYTAILSQVLSGSNVSQYATDNASAGLADRRLAAGNPGVRISGELFYVNIYGSGGGGVPAHERWYNSHTN